MSVNVYDRRQAALEAAAEVERALQLTPSARESQRQRIAAQVAEFEARGGQVQALPDAVSGRDASVGWHEQNRSAWVRAGRE